MWHSILFVKQVLEFQSKVARRGPPGKSTFETEIAMIINEMLQ